MRIVSLAPSNTEILFALGAEDSIVARTAYCDYPPDALKIPGIVDLQNPEIDKLKKLNPSLVLTSTVAQRKLADTLDDNGLPVAHLAPRNLKGVLDSINEVGDLIGKTDEATSVVLDMSRELDRIRFLTKEKKPRTYIEEWHDPPMVSGNWIPDLTEIAGGEYLFKSGKYSREFLIEELQGFDPQIIILSVCGVELEPDIVKKRKGWKNISAVKKNNIYVFDDSLLNRPGPRLVEGCRQLSALFCKSLL